ncbi:MAG: hypothetical protein M1832_005593 [Thelocarpon impressellum]|nr:MAG: hypothetical protein M1832_005593 [Thelocarpon impressellum]
MLPVPEVYPARTSVGLVGPKGKGSPVPERMSLETLLCGPPDTSSSEKNTASRTLPWKHADVDAPDQNPPHSKRRATVKRLRELRAANEDGRRKTPSQQEAIVDPEPLANTSQPPERLLQQVDDLEQANASKKLALQNYASRFHDLQAALQTKDLELENIRRLLEEKTGKVNAQEKRIEGLESKRVRLFRELDEAQRATEDRQRQIYNAGKRAEEARREMVAKEKELCDVSRRLEDTKRALEARESELSDALRGSEETRHNLQEMEKRVENLAEAIKASVRRSTVVEGDAETVDAEKSLEAEATCQVDRTDDGDLSDGMKELDAILFGEHARGRRDRGAALEDLEWAALDPYETYPEFAPWPSDPDTTAAEPTRLQRKKRGPDRSRAAEYALSTHERRRTRTSATEEGEEAEDARRPSMSMAELMHFPKNPITVTQNGRLAFRDGTRGPNGRLPRAKQLFYVGRNVPGELR